MQKERVFHYIKQAVDELVEQDRFDTGDEFRLTQRQALHDYAEDLVDDTLSLNEKLTGFFEIPTGIGKTALFLSIIGKAHHAAKANGEEMRSVIVVPRTKIMRDTYNKDAKKFIPDLIDDIGRHGDGHKEKDKPIMLMTYRAFEKLTKSYELGPENVDLLATDESHRGISENMTDNVVSAYQDTDTALLGFTASSEFDDARSVYNTHRRAIYEKKIGQAVREGEQLAEYIQTQNYIIRVEPQDLKELQKTFYAVALSDTDYKTRMKQAAWNKAMIRVLRDGRDERTKEPLTDNQGGLYVQDTTHADVLETQLNADPVLAQRAAAQGYKKMAVAIHSHRSKAANRQAFKDYEAGKILMIVGDDMFKEGYDYPPMKTVLDYQRGSLVDKVQILGRGARRWFNERKDRYEGLTFIDSIIYIGSDDDKIDLQRETRARRNAVTARDVMNGEAYVLSPKEAKKEEALKEKDLTYKRGKVIFPDDDNIKEYTDLEALETFSSEQGEFKKDRFKGYEPIPEEDLAFLRSEAERTGLGGSAIFSTTNLWPNGLTGSHAADVVHGDNKTSRPIWIGALKATYIIQPDSENEPISEEDLAFLKSAAERTGVGGKIIFKSITTPPTGLNKENAYALVAGKRKNAPPSWIKALKEAYLLLPDAKTKKPISKGDLEFLQSEVTRTGLTGGAIFKMIKDPPEGFDGRISGNVVRGVRKYLHPLWVKTLKKAYRKQPTSNLKKVKQEPISKEDFAFLKSEAERTGLKGAEVFNRMKKRPEGMTKRHAASIQSGEKHAAPPSFTQALKVGYKNQLDKIIKYKPISYAEWKFLRSEVDRTRLNGAAAFNLIEHSPEGMTKFDANDIIVHQKAKPSAFIKALKEIYAKQPDATPKPRPKLELISEEDRAFLKSEAKRTGLGGRGIFYYIETAPYNMTPRYAEKILKGQKSAPLSYVDTLKKAYKEQPNAKKGPKLELISEEDRTFLKLEVQRTGLRPHTIFNYIEELPEGMTKRYISHIIDDDKKYAPPSYIIALKVVYQKQLDAKPQEPKPKPEPISQEDLAFLKSESKRTSLSGYVLFNRIAHPPQGMTQSQANKIVAGNRKSAPPLYVEALKNSFLQQPDKKPSSNNQLPPDELGM